MAGELEYRYNTNVTPVWMELICGWLGPVIFLLGLCLEPVAWWLAFQDFWWQVWSFFF